MESKNAIWSLVGLVIVSLILSFMTLGGISNLGGNDLSKADVKAIVNDALDSQGQSDVPTAQEIADLVVIPEIPDVESADNVLLNEFLESEFSDEYDEIEDEAEAHATEELEDHDYRFIEDYLMTLLAEGEVLDEDSLDVDVDDVDVVVTKLGLEEDDDKSARVTFELEVEYELEEGVRDTFEKDIIVVFDILYDEGDFSDEDVTLVSIA